MSSHERGKFSSLPAPLFQHALNVLNFDKMMVDFGDGGIDDSKVRGKLKLKKFQKKIKNQYL